MWKRLQSESFLKDFDWSLFASALVLSSIGLAEIYSSTMTLEGGYFFRQLVWVIVGIVAMLVVASLDYHVLSEHISWLYLGGVGVLGYVLAFGKTVSSSKSWIVLGPVSLQPSELVDRKSTRLNSSH